MIDNISNCESFKNKKLSKFTDTNPYEHLRGYDHLGSPDPNFLDQDQAEDQGKLTEKVTVELGLTFIFLLFLKSGRTLSLLKARQSGFQSTFTQEVSSSEVQWAWSLITRLTQNWSLSPPSSPPRLLVHLVCQS